MPAITMAHLMPRFEMGMRTSSWGCPRGYSHVLEMGLWQGGEWIGKDFRWRRIVQVSLTLIPSSISPSTLTLTFTRGGRGARESHQSREKERLPTGERERGEWARAGEEVRSEVGLGGGGGE